MRFKKMALGIIVDGVCRRRMPSIHGTGRHGCGLCLGDAQHPVLRFRKFPVLFGGALLYIGTVIPGFPLFQYNDVTGAFQNTVAFLRQRRTQRNDLRVVSFHRFGKFADMEDGIARVVDFQMVFVDEPAETVRRFPIFVFQPDFVTICQPEQFFVAAVNKANAMRGPFQMLVQPVAPIAVAVQVVLAPLRVQSKQIGVLRGIGAKTIFMAFAGLGLSCSGQGWFLQAGALQR